MEFIELDRKILAVRACRLLQLRSRHGDYLEIGTISRADSLEARFMGAGVAEPPGQRTVPLGMDFLPQGKDR